MKQNDNKMNQAFSLQIISQTGEENIPLGQSKTISENNNRQYQKQ